jgi:hypothetical protein
MRPATLAASLLAVALAAPPVHAEPSVVLVGTNRLKMKDDTVEPISPGKRLFIWKVRSGVLDQPENQVVTPAHGSEGDPSLHGATLTVYNAAGSGEVFTTDLPAESWVQRGDGSKGWRYIYSSSTTAIRKIYLKSPKITLKGGKAAWGYSLDEPSQGQIAVQLTLGTAVTWCSVAEPESPLEKWDVQDRFRAVAAGAPPAACPPIPNP